ncbi:MAG: GspH/FimT family pseudopilin [Pseudomonadota bacterium]
MNVHKHSSAHCPHRSAAACQHNTVTPHSRCALVGERGLTLLELLVTLAVGTLLLTYALPSWSTVLANGRQSAAVNRFVTSVLLARSIAITQRTHAIVCPKADGPYCDLDGDWSRGWLVMRSPDQHEAPLDSPQLEVVQTMNEVSLVPQSNRRAFRFRPNNKRATNGTVVFCARDAATPKAVIVSYNGRPRTATRQADGSVIECVGT